jgi:transcriptional regulator with XRE-family HTH domain
MLKMDTNKLLAKWVRAARDHAELSGEQLGARLALELGTERGNSKANISHWEKERHQPNLAQIMAIAKITGFKLPAEILEYIAEPNKSESEIPRSRTENIHALNWNSLEEIEILSAYRQSTPAGKAFIRQFAQEAEKEISKVRAIN